MAIRRTTEFLDGQKVKYTVLHHSAAFTAQEIAASAHVPGRSMAKTVVVHLDGRLALAVVAANQEVNMALLRKAAQAETVGLADTAEFVSRFEGCQLGTMPPLGNLFGLDTFVDADLAKEEYIAFNAGSHTDLVAMRFNDYRRIAHPRLVNISELPTAGLGQSPTASNWSRRHQ